jgi:hypothetical protein
MRRHRPQLARYLMNVLLVPLRDGSGALWQGMRSRLITVIP